MEVKNAWCTDASREGLGGVVAALKHVRNALCSWSWKIFGMVTQELEELRAKLEEARADPLYSTREVRQISDPNVQPAELIDLIEPKLTQDLCRELSTEEISDALFQMGPLKSPRPNGFPARFFQVPKTLGSGEG
jgi:hypothetical protein